MIKPNWISVLNSLPPDDNIYLVFIIFYSSRGSYGSTHFGLYDEDERKWYIESGDELDGYDSDILFITHWSERPEPPDGCKDIMNK